MPASQVIKLKAREAQKQVPTVADIENSDEETLLDKYIRVIGKNPSPRYKNNEEYLSKAIAEKLAETADESVTIEETTEEAGE